MNPVNVLVDLDGTLAQTSDRIHFVTAKDLKQWDRFHEAGSRAKSYKDSCMVVNALQQSGFRIHIITGRTANWQKQTEVWLAQHFVRYHELTMRPVGDYRPDVEFKMEHFRKYHPDAVLLIMEDRDRVVLAARLAGYTVYHVRPGAF